MFLSKLEGHQHWVEVMETTPRSQSEVRHFEPGQVSAEEPDAHPASDQVFLVIEGEVTAHVADEIARMRPGHVVVIPAGVAHRFENSGSGRARTFSVFTPSDYPKPGSENRKEHREHKESLNY